ncbi:hypothetical protein Agabi119p4_8104 [Agaricus bisporus var. burnettii]|uniref:SPX domain-containing protein n=1 Tax=Agaricus bisporus var. burnettii TaxID=192524 RepID=A0A8H7C6F3_AGABI|nr:hypothetical protein Agabi119p4_8104 [Agaricus bisporus var. burnettii]
MKFAQNLEDTQTPEWKRAYLDYRGLKKFISVIRRAHEAAAFREPSLRSPIAKYTAPDTHRFVVSAGADNVGKSPRFGNSVADATQRTEQEGSVSSPQLPGNFSHRRRFSVLSMGGQRVAGRSYSVRSGKTPARPVNPMAALPLGELRTHLSPQEEAFFDHLDAQLEKVESFYSAREGEMIARTALLQQQLLELQDHSRAIHQKTDSRNTWTSGVTTALKVKFRPHPAIDIPASHSPGKKSTVTSLQDEVSQSKIVSSPGGKPNGEGSGARNHDTGQHDVPQLSELDHYLYAKKNLKKAALEHYRGLELLQNYRILNLTGFRKALKKFEKVTKIRAQEQYMVEKVDSGVLGSDKTLQDMQRTMQELYAQAFLGGDVKRAMGRLRGGARTKTHHFSTFRSGLLIGVGLPALAAGIYQSTLDISYDSIEAFDALLYIYGVLFIPVCFSLLVGLNVVVWARSRVNYSFIFEFDIRTRLDYREYFEIPSFLFATLCYAFWLSFARIGFPSISPHVWPLVWLGLTATILFDPLPFQSRPSRYWILRKLGRLFISGTQRVEFADFWLGDQLCSLVFTLSNLYLFACLYAEDFNEDWSNCTTQANTWPIVFLLSALPFIIRLIQSIKRYADSGLVTHLINGGKYGVGILYYLFYTLWRHQRTHYNTLFVIWLVFGISYTIYAATWDFLMDWSLLKPHAKHFLLRDELGYSNHVYLYYFAMVTNVLIRFSWVIYIPQSGPSSLIRSFVVGFLEMLRRVQWNFYRLENEHLGNMDQYRVTREVPLPYTFDHHSTDEDEGPVSKSRSSNHEKRINERN